jgi:hypothetical protein
MQTTVNDKLVELGTLVNNKDNAIQRDGGDNCACSPLSNRHSSA